jgi:hypothetical protein
LRAGQEHQDVGGPFRIKAGAEPAIACQEPDPAGPGPLHCRVELRPALRFEDLQESIFWLVRTGKLDRKSPASLLQVGTVFHHYLDEARAASPPAIIQRAVLGPLAALGRLRGYTPHPGYGG